MLTYLQKHSLFPAQIASTPSSNLTIIVVIPCHNEPDIIPSLESLKNCLPPKGSVEVIIVINASEKHSSTVHLQNEATLKAIQTFQANLSLSWIQFHVLYHPNLPPKHAGVGLARKIGMDEAVHRLLTIKQTKGILICFDADALCEPNYFLAIANFFETYPNKKAVSIHYEHPLRGAYSTAIYQSIIQYELFLRYFILAQQYAGHPHAYQTIGSSMAVRVDGYQEQSGMNRRKAGEDFYFLHKFSEIDQLGALRTTKVIPSPRPSDRVPFGTGKAVNEMLDNGIDSYQAYHPNTFQDLKTFLQQIDKLYTAPYTTVAPSLPKSIRDFAEKSQFPQKLAIVRQQTKQPTAFRKRFFRLVNAFWVLKYTHFARDHFYPPIPVREGVIWLLNALGHDQIDQLTDQELLVQLRLY